MELEHGYYDDYSVEGKIIGEFRPTGYVPTFYTEIEVNKLPFPKDKFAIKTAGQGVKVNQTQVQQGQNIKNVA